jgi:acyl-homoserine lactone acylase PvdQ
MLALAAPAAAKDYADTALNIIPSGQYGAVPPPAGAEKQAQMYDALTPLFGSIKDADLTKYFKSEALGSLGSDGPGTNEAVPRPGLTIVRDAYNVPHIAGQTRDDAIFGAGWVTAEDRGLLLNVALGPARVAAVDVPGIDAFGLVRSLRSFEPSQETEEFIARQTQVLENAGPKGRQLLHDIDVFLSGINAYRSANGGAALSRNDIYAANALLAQFLGQGGGSEVRSSQLLANLRKRLGARKASGVYDDLRSREDPETVVTIGGRFPYGEVPSRRTGNVVFDDETFTPALKPVAGAGPASPQRASNILMVSGRRSTTGHPIFVGGPQIGYFYPGLTLEMDVKAPGLNWRGATSVPFPGYLLIGRGEDFALTLTSAGADVIDQFAETLCGGDDFHYMHEGECKEMGTFRAGVLKGAGGEPDRDLTFRTTAHGPVAGYATSGGRRYAISNSRSTRGRETLFQLLFQDASYGRIKDPESFYDAAAQSPLTFNAFYADHRNIATYTAGRLPLRAPGVDPGLPTKGTGDYEWRGFLEAGDHPHGANPRSGYITNWNNKPARGFQAADDTFGYTPVMRDELLRRGINRRSRHTLASVVAAMNMGATQDVRVMEALPSILAAMRGAAAPSDRDAILLSILEDWREEGGSRLDKDLDGTIDHPGAAILDTAWNRLADAVMVPTLGQFIADQLDGELISRFNLPPSGQFSGWMGYMNKDLRTLVGAEVRGEYSRGYCGKGKLRSCAKALWAALHAAGDELQAAQGTDPFKWRADATRERIAFGPVALTTMSYTNRPSGIQQVISFDDHR